MLGYLRLDRRSLCDSKRMAKFMMDMVVGGSWDWSLAF